MWNTAPAPFDGKWADPAHAPEADLDGLLPYPEVLRFRIVDGTRQRRSLPAQLTGDYPRIDRASLHGGVHRSVALVELHTVDDTPSMLTLRELVEDPDGTGPAITVTELDDDRQSTSRWRTVATRFEDRATFLPTLGEAEVWRFINLTNDTHPIHVHLDAFELLARQPATIEVDDKATDARDTAATVRVGQVPDDGIPHTIDDNECGFKDTVRVNPHEVVDIAVRFDTYAGRYMYHCHILEHEDRDMMRPFIVTPPELIPFMDMGSSPNTSSMM